MATITSEIYMHAASSKIWDILYEEFGEIYYWSSLVHGSHEIEILGDGGLGRQCETVFGQMTEVIEELNVAEKTLGTSCIAMARPFYELRSTITVSRKCVNTCLLSFQMHYRMGFVDTYLLGWYWKSRLKKDVRQNFKDLKYYAETDRRSLAKIEANQKFNSDKIGYQY